MCLLFISFSWDWMTTKMYLVGTWGYCFLLNIIFQCNLLNLAMLPLQLALFTEITQDQWQLMAIRINTFLTVLIRLSYIKLRPGCALTLRESSACIQSNSGIGMTVRIHIVLILPYCSYFFLYLFIIYFH